MMCIRTIFTLAGLLFLVGCSVPPTKVIIFRGPHDVAYSVETWEDNGAISSDFTRVFAQVEGSGSRSKVLVMDGAYLVIPRVT